MSEKLYEALLALDEVTGNTFISAVVPCYNEEKNLDELRRRLIPACERVAGNNFEIILVDDGYDVVYGKRRNRAGETAFKRGTARLFYRILDRLVDIDIPLDTGDFRLMSRRVVDVLQAMPERYRFVRGMISWIGFPQTAFEYERDVRFAGETKYPLRKMLLLAIDAITSFSVIPLRIASLAGVFCAFLGIIYGIFTLGAWFTGSVVPGWTSLTLIVLLLGGVQLIVIGIIGEYLGRLYMQSKERPMFLIEEVLRRDVPTPRAKRMSA